MLSCWFTSINHLHIWEHFESKLWSLVKLPDLMSHAYSYSIIYFVRNYCFFSDKIDYAHYFSWSRCAKVGSFFRQEARLRRVASPPARARNFWQPNLFRAAQKIPCYVLSNIKSDWWRVGYQCFSIHTDAGMSYPTEEWGKNKPTNVGRNISISIWQNECLDKLINGHTNDPFV